MRHRSRHKRRGRGDKRKAELIHARNRYAERFGVSLPRALVTDFVRRIQSGEAKFLRRQSGRITIWLLEHTGKQIKAVYDKQRKMIVTMMPYGPSK